MPRRRLVARFWDFVEDDSVRGFIPLYYTPWLIWAIFATFLFPPVSILQEAMGHGVYVAWVWITIPGAIAPLVGLAMRHGGSDIDDMGDLLLFRDWMGLCLQATGHAVMCVLLILFEYSAILGAMAYWKSEGVYAGMTILVAFLLSSYMFGTAVLSLQCLRKIHKGEQLKRCLA